MSNEQFAEIVRRLDALEARLSPADEWMDAKAAARYAKVGARKILQAAKFGLLKHEVADRRGRILTKKSWIEEWRAR